MAGASYGARTQFADVGIDGRGARDPAGLVAAEEDEVSSGYM